MDWDGSPLSEYELLRQRNIQRNHDFMRQLGLPVRSVSQLQKRPRRQQVKKKTVPSCSSSEDSESDSSDKEWLPGSEELRERNRTLKRYIPDFRPKPQLLPTSKQGIPFKTKQVKSSSKRDKGTDGKFLENEKKFFNVNQQHSHFRSTDRYPKRVTTKCYKEAEVPDDDHYLFCEECQAINYGDCLIHGPLTEIKDSPISPGNVMALAKASLPVGLEIKDSNIPNAGYGIYSNINIKKGTRFGPYIGNKVKMEEVAEETNTSYMWEIVKDGKFRYFVDGEDESKSNWLRYVNCSRCENEQNLVAFQYRGEIYYRTYKDIKPGTELLVWYGDKYAEELGISIEEKEVSASTSFDNGEMLQRHRLWHRAILLSACLCH